MNFNYAAMPNPRQEENEDDWKDYEGDDGDVVEDEEWDDASDWEDCEESGDEGQGVEEEQEPEQEQEEENDEREIRMNIRIVVAWLSHEYPWLNEVE